jgi:hypothetical protein
LRESRAAIHGRSAQEEPLQYEKPRYGGVFLWFGEVTVTSSCLDSGDRSHEISKRFGRAALAWI